VLFRSHSLFVSANNSTKLVAKEGEVE